MAAHTKIFADEETNNWFKASIAFNLTKVGLTDFIETIMKTVHKNIGSSCGKCDIQQVIPCPIEGLCKTNPNGCSFHKSYYPNNCQRCHKVRRGIRLYHRFNGPSWKNTKAQDWISNWWEIAKCYLPREGYANVSSIQESDFNAVINIMLNCTEFQKYISSWLSPPPPDPHCRLEKLRKIGHNLRHSGTCKTTDAELQDYFQKLKQLLADVAHLTKNRIAKQAVNKLTDLQNDRLPLTEFGHLVQDFKQAIERIKDAAEEEFSKKGKQTLEEGLNKIKEDLKDVDQVIGKKIQQANTEITAKMIETTSQIEQKKVESDLTLYDTTEYCKQKIGDETEALTKNSVQLIEDETKDSIGRIQHKMTETTSQIENKKGESVQTLYDTTKYCKQKIGDETEALTKNSAQLIKDETKESIERIQHKMTETTSQIEEKKGESVQILYDTTEYCKRKIEDETETLTKSSVQFIKDQTKDSIEYIKQTVADKANNDDKGNAEDFRRRLVDHYRDTVSYVSLSALNPSHDKHIQDIYVTPKVHRIKIEKDGKRTKEEQIFSYKDCFNKDDNLRRRIYLQGEPGSGKSTFSANLVHEWCKIYLPSTESTNENTFVDLNILQNFKILFFISLPDSRHQNDVMHMIQTQIIDKIYMKHEREEGRNLCIQIMKNEIFLVIQDGLDEWSSDQALPSMPGIPKDNCIVLTTSRPWKLADERIRNSQIDILLEIDGIDDPEAFNERILRCLLDESIDFKKSIEQFKKFLESRNLKSISSSPMLLALVLCTWVDGFSERLTGSSLCDLYTTLLDCLCKKASSEVCYYNTLKPPPVQHFNGTQYLRPNNDHINAIAEAAFVFLFSNEKETSIVFSDVQLSDYLLAPAKEFALKSGVLSKRKAKRDTDTTCRFIHKTLQEYLSAYHIANKPEAINDVISKYLKCHDDSYLEISYMFTFLCGLNISAANELSALMNEHDIDCNNHWAFQKCILSGYKEAVANKNTPIDLYLSHFNFYDSLFEELSQIWAMNRTRARSLDVLSRKTHRPILICSRDAVSTRCDGHGPVSVPACDGPGDSNRVYQDEVGSSASCRELDVSCCDNLEQLQLWDNVTVLPNSLVGLKKLKDLKLYKNCKCEALDLSHHEHIESIDICNGVTLLPLSTNNYKTLKCIEIHTTYDGLDVSLFENLSSITITNKVKVVQKQSHFYNKHQITYIGLSDFDLNSFDNKDIYTWCLLNGTDPVHCEDYAPVLPSIEHIHLHNVTFSSTWLRSLLSTLLTLDKRVTCELSRCTITSTDHEVKSRLQGTKKASCVEHAGNNPLKPTWAKIFTFLNKTCTIEVCDLIQQNCLWDTMHGLNIKNLSMSTEFKSDSLRFKMYPVPPPSQSLASLSQLETLRVDLPEYIDLQLPPSLKHLTFSFYRMSPSDLHDLVNKLSAWTNSVECILEFYCVHNINRDMEKIQPEEYIPIRQKLRAMKHVEVKMFRIYDIAISTLTCSLRDSVGVDVDHADESIHDWRLSYLPKYTYGFFLKIRDLKIDSLDAISMRLQINCAKGPDLT